MNDILYNYIKILKNVKMAQNDLLIINTAQSHIDNFDFDKAQDFLEVQVYKHQKIISQIGKIYQDRYVETNNYEQMYEQKNDQDIIEDLVYLQEVIMIDLLKKCDIISDYNQIIDKLEK